MFSNWLLNRKLILLLGLLALPGTLLQGARISDVSATKHNLSSGSGNDVQAQLSDQGTDEICVFCHTPHGANTNVDGPLWNRAAATADGYTEYFSSSLDAGVLDAPGGSSKLCLSCHDGTIAVGAVINKPGSGNYDASPTRPDPISMIGTDGGSMPAGSYGADSGFTRLLGVSLKNDHPISVEFNAALAALDGELATPSADTMQEVIGASGAVIVGARGVNNPLGKPLLPLEKESKASLADDARIQCATCHDPHIRETNPAVTLGESIKFLRLNRFQLQDPIGTFREDVDIICLACHVKAGWETSAHALGESGGPADDKFKNGTETTKREFQVGMPVYKAACLSCHDPHTETGAERLAREGADSASKSAIEETCYQCHNTTSASIIESEGGGATDAPNIFTEFQQSVHMPITTGPLPGDQRASSPVHDIEDADFFEVGATLGKPTINNRHAECTDCHNPHRVIRNSRFNADAAGDPSKRTHRTGFNGGAGNDGREGNVASGALRGSFGLEAQGKYDSHWPQLPDLLTRGGDPGPGATTNSQIYLTKEYQLCFKCHSNYALNQPVTVPLGGHGGATLSNTNRMLNYTNVAAEFSSVNATNPPTSNNDQGENHGGTASNRGTACGGADCEPVPSLPGGANNHRSWHPVMFPTGRDRVERAIAASGTINFKGPWTDNIGKQTMHCSDCHGRDGSYDPNTGALDSQVQGPHGSGSIFLLKSGASNLWGTNGSLSNGTGLYSAPANYGFCGNCHQPRAGGNSSSGFSGNSGHQPDDKMGREPCMNCHIAVPHGWKNKAFLVNLECVGPEEGAEGLTCGRPALSNYTGPGADRYNIVNIGPYYNGARTRMESWRRSGTWNQAACGGGAMADGCSRSF